MDSEIIDKIGKKYHLYIQPENNSFKQKMEKNMSKIKQFFCGLTNHKFKSSDTDCKYDDVNKTCTITETCYKCGKKFSFTAPSKNFGLRG